MADLAEIVRSQSAEIARLLSALDAQTRTVQALLGERRSPPAPTADAVTFSGLWSRYLETLPPARWVRSVRSMMIRPLAHFGPLPVDAIRPSHWSDFRDGVLKRGEHGTTTRNLILRRIKSLFNWAASDGRLDANPWQHVKPERAPPMRETEITEGGLSQILDGAPTLLRVFVIVAIDSGMREAEVRTLEWEQIDLDRRRVVLSWVRTKSKKTRTPRLTERAVAALLEMPRYPSVSYVFANPNTGRPYTACRMWQLFRAAVDASGVQAAPGDSRIHMHDTRHSYASRLARGGAKINQIQKLLGHASLQTVARYLHVNEDDLDEAHAVLSQAIRKDAHRAPAPENDAAGTDRNKIRVSVLTG